jgi:hypothetical protein
LFQQRDENFEATLGMLMSALSQRRTLVSTVVMSAKGQKLPRASAAKRMLAWRRFIVAPAALDQGPVVMKISRADA